MSLAPVSLSDEVAVRSLRSRLGWYRFGRGDPTTQFTPTRMIRASWTPTGPATVVLDWSGGAPMIRSWGPGAGSAEASTWQMAALDKVPDPLPDVHPVVTTAAHRQPGIWAGASGDLYHALLPVIIAQRITAGEAMRQWARLCRELGEAAPGPELGVMLPPVPARLAGLPAWWFHPLGIEAKRARPLIEVARLADRLWTWAALPLDEASAKLRLLRGIGAWTVGSVLGPACGDEDAVAVGDYHLKNMVAWNLAGEARADDDRMLSLLEPFRGQRGRVIRLLSLVGNQAPAFGPRRRILPMHRW